MSCSRLPEGSRFAVLASGSGTNLQALLDAYPENLAVVGGDKRDAFAFERARRAGVPVEFVDPKKFASREEHDAELARRLSAYDVSLVVGAGYMRVLSSVFLEKFPAVINVHPSLLPDFRGLDAVGRALRAGVEKTGVTVHYMVEEVDSGPIIAQEEVPVLPDDTKETLLKRLHPVEHRLLVGAVADHFWERRAAVRALLSVYDKTGIVEFAKELSGMGWDLLSSGGTASALREAGIPVTDTAEFTGFPAILGHRVVTLHPKIHGGILANRADPEHESDLDRYGIEPIDLVVVNLYPFETNPSVEMIDVGGPAMVRAAAKNHAHVTVITAPSDYEPVLEELRSNGALSEKTRERLARDAFARTAAYDAAVAAWLESTGDEEDDLPQRLNLQYEKVLPLRYGENPHQRAAYYARSGEEHLLSDTKKLQGKELSFNNLYDVDAARSLLADLGDIPAAVIIKHANPCGAAVGRALEEAYGKALASDPQSAFGGIVALNGKVDGELAGKLTKVFTEVLISPGFTPEAREVFSSKPNTILLEAGPLAIPARVFKPVTGGILLQDADETEDSSKYRVVTEKKPTDHQMEDLLFAWRVAKRVKSNAIVLAKDGATVGVGAGQMSRVDSSEIAVKKAGERVHGSVAASDAFFPFADGVEALAGAGVAAIIQPGGSRRDGEVIDAANRAGIAMVFTGRRHFLH